MRKEYLNELKKANTLIDNASTISNERDYIQTRYEQDKRLNRDGAREARKRDLILDEYGTPLTDSEFKRDVKEFGNTVLSSVDSLANLVGLSIDKRFTTYKDGKEYSMANKDFSSNDSLRQLVNEFHDAKEDPNASHVVYALRKFDGFDENYNEKYIYKYGTAKVGTYDRYKDQYIKGGYEVLGEKRFAGAKDWEKRWNANDEVLKHRVFDYGADSKDESGVGFGSGKTELLTKDLLGIDNGISREEAKDNYKRSKEYTEKYYQDRAKGDSTLFSAFLAGGAKLVTDTGDFVLDVLDPTGNNKWLEVDQKTIDEFVGYDRREATEAITESVGAWKRGDYFSAVTSDMLTKGQFFTESLPMMVSMGMGLGEINAVKATKGLIEANKKLDKLESQYNSISKVGDVAKKSQDIEVQKKKIEALKEATINDLKHKYGLEKAKEVAKWTEVPIKYKAINNVMKDLGFHTAVGTQTNQIVDERIQNGDTDVSMLETIGIAASQYLMLGLDKLSFNNIINSDRIKKSFKDAYSIVDSNSKAKILSKITSKASSLGMSAGAEGVQEYIQTWGEILGANVGIDGKSFEDVLSDSDNQDEALGGALAGAGAGMFGKGVSESIDTVKLGASYAANRFDKKSEDIDSIDLDFVPLKTKNELDVEKNPTTVIGTYIKHLDPLSSFKVSDIPSDPKEALNSLKDHLNNNVDTVEESKKLYKDAIEQIIIRTLNQGNSVEKGTEEHERYKKVINTVLKDPDVDIQKVFNATMKEDIENLNRMLSKGSKSLSNNDEILDNIMENKDEEEDSVMSLEVVQAVVSPFIKKYETLSETLEDGELKEKARLTSETLKKYHDEGIDFSKKTASNILAEISEIGFVGEKDGIIKYSLNDYNEKLVPSIQKDGKDSHMFTQLEIFTKSRTGKKIHSKTPKNVANAIKYENAKLYDAITNTIKQVENIEDIKDKDKVLSKLNFLEKTMKKLPMDSTIKLSDITSEPKKVKPIKMDTSTKARQKDAEKFKIANKLIAFGEKGTSTYKYYEDNKEVANTGNYTKDDIVAVSLNGFKRPNYETNYNKAINEIDKAIKAGAIIITDKTGTSFGRRNSSHNRLIEGKLAEYLHSKGYVEDDNNGVWKPKKVNSTSIEDIKKELDKVITFEELKSVILKVNTLPPENRKELITAITTKRKKLKDKGNGNDVITISSLIKKIKEAKTVDEIDKIIKIGKDKLPSSDVEKLLQVSEDRKKEVEDTGSSTEKLDKVLKKIKEAKTTDELYKLYKDINSLPQEVRTKVNKAKVQRIEEIKKLGEVVLNGKYKHIKPIKKGIIVFADGKGKKLIKSKEELLEVITEISKYLNISISDNNVLENILDITEFKPFTLDMSKPYQGNNKYMYGMFFSDTDSIELYTKAIVNNTIPHTIDTLVAHEYLHHITVKKINNNQEYKKVLNDLLNVTRKALSTKYPDLSVRKELNYGLTNEREFIAEAFSNKQFAEELNTITYKDTSVLKRFINMIKTMFGITVNSNSVLANTIDTMLHYHGIDKKKETSLPIKDKLEPIREVIFSTISTLEYLKRESNGIINDISLYNKLIELNDLIDDTIRSNNIAGIKDIKSLYADVKTQLALMPVFMINPVDSIDTYLKQLESSLNTLKAQLNNLTTKKQVKLQILSLYKVVKSQYDKEVKEIEKAKKEKEDYLKLQKKDSPSTTITKLQKTIKYHNERLGRLNNAKKAVERKLTKGGRTIKKNFVKYSHEEISKLLTDLKSIEEQIFKHTEKLDKTKEKYTTVVENYTESIYKRTMKKIKIILNNLVVAIRRLTKKNLITEKDYKKLGDILNNIDNLTAHGLDVLYKEVKDISERYTTSDTKTLSDSLLESFTELSKYFKTRNGRIHRLLNANSSQIESILEDIDLTEEQVRNLFSNVNKLGIKTITKTKYITSFEDGSFKNMNDLFDGVHVLSTITKEGDLYKVTPHELVQKTIKLATSYIIFNNKEITSRIINTDKQDLIKDTGLDENALKNYLALVYKGFIPDALIKKELEPLVRDMLGVYAGKDVKASHKDILSESVIAHTLLQLKSLSSNGLVANTTTTKDDQSRNYTKVNTKVVINKLGITEEELNGLRGTMRKITYLSDSKKRSAPKAIPYRPKTTIINSNTPLQKIEIEAIKKYNTTPYTFTEDSEAFRELYNSSESGKLEVLKAFGYKEIDTDSMTPIEIRSQLSINMKVELEADILFDNVENFKSNEFYLEHGITKSKRLTVTSDLTYQDSKIHREFVTSESYHVKINTVPNNKKDINSIDINNLSNSEVFEVYLHQAFDLDPDKKGKHSVYKDIRDIVDIYGDNGVIIKSKKYEWLDKFINSQELDLDLFNANANNTGRLHQLRAILELRKLNLAKKNNNHTIVTTLTGEADAITSGGILQMMQIWSDGMQSLLSKGGVFTEKTKKYWEKYTKHILAIKHGVSESSIEFSSPTLIEAGAYHVNSLNSKNLEIGNYTYTTPYLDIYTTVGKEVQDYIKILKENKSISAIDTQLIEAFGTLTLKELRKMAKDPVMTFNYGAMLSTIKKSLVEKYGIDLFVNHTTLRNSILRKASNISDKDSTEVAKKKIKKTYNKVFNTTTNFLIYNKEKNIVEHPTKEQLDKMTEEEKLKSLTSLPDDVYYTLSTAFNNTLGNSFEKAFKSLFKDIEYNRNAIKIVDTVVSLGFRTELKNRLDKLQKSKGEEATIEDVNNILKELENDGYGHSLVIDGKIQPFYKTVKSRGNMGTAVYVQSYDTGSSYTSVSSYIANTEHTDNTGASATVPTHNIDANIILRAIGDNDYTSIYDAIIFGAEQSQMVDGSNRYQESTLKFTGRHNIFTEYALKAIKMVKDGVLTTTDIKGLISPITTHSDNTITDVVNVSLPVFKWNTKSKKLENHGMGKHKLSTKILKYGNVIRVEYYDNDSKNIVGVVVLEEYKDGGYLLNTFFHKNYITPFSKGGRPYQSLENIRVHSSDIAIENVIEIINNSIINNVPKKGMKGSNTKNFTPINSQKLDSISRPEIKQTPLLFLGLQFNQYVDSIKKAMKNYDSKYKFLNSNSTLTVHHLAVTGTLPVEVKVTNEKEYQDINELVDIMEEVTSMIDNDVHEYFTNTLSDIILVNEQLVKYLDNREYYTVNPKTLFNNEVSDTIMEIFPKSYYSAIELNNIKNSEVLSLVEDLKNIKDKDDNVNDEVQEIINTIVDTAKRGDLLEAFMTLKKSDKLC